MFKQSLRLANQIYHYARAVYDGGPNYMILFVTGRCNLRCPHCFYLTEIENANAARELKIWEFEKISKSLPHLLQLTCSGGETFIRQDIDEIAHLFYTHSNTRFFTFTTNGTFPERIAEKVGAIAKSCPNAVIRIPLSIDGTAEIHDVARGRPGTWEKVMKTYGLLRQLADTVDNVRIDVTSVLSKINEGNILDLVEYVQKNLQIENHTVLYARGAIRDKDKILPEQLRYQELVTKTFDRRRKKYDFPVISRAFVMLREAVENVIVEVQKTGSLPFACQAGERLIEMNEYGKLFPCEILDTLIKEKQVSFEPDFDDTWLGDVRDFDYDVPKALNSPEAKKVRKFIQDKGCACTYECALGASIAFEPKNYATIVWKKLMAGAAVPFKQSSGA